MTRPGNSKTSFAMYTIVSLVAVICLTAVDAQIRQVSVIFRHGDRAPDDNIYEMYPNDPYLDYDFYPEGRGQLTNRGKMREYELGKLLRQRYAGLLGEVYTKNSVSAISSDFDRTKMSVQLVLASLYPPSNVQRWHPLLNWQPIPTRYNLRVDDYMFLSDECANYLEELKKEYNTTEVQREVEKYKSFMEDLTIWTGKPITTPLDMYFLYHTLMAESSLDLPLPSWTNGIFPYGKLFNGTVLFYQLAAGNLYLRRMQSGGLFRDITKNILDYVTGTDIANLKRIYLYSGHETNVAATLNAFDAYKPHVPAYSSAVIFELHEIAGAFYVKLIHYKGIPAETEEFTVPGCEVLCPLEKYLDFVEPLMPTLEDLNCNKRLTPAYADVITSEERDLLKYNLIRKASVKD